MVNNNNNKKAINNKKMIMTMKLTKWCKISLCNNLVINKGNNNWMINSLICGIVLVIKLFIKRKVIKSKIITNCWIRKVKIVWIRLNRKINLNKQQLKTYQKHNKTLKVVDHCLVTWLNNKNNNLKSENKWMPSSTNSQMVISWLVSDNSHKSSYPHLKVPLYLSSSIFLKGLMLK